MGIILASLLTLFVTRSYYRRLLSCLLVLYVLFNEILILTKLPTFEDYLMLYTASCLLFCTVILLNSGSGVLKKILAISVVVPQLYYLLVLYKPYLLSEHIPMWFMLYADKLFIYGVFALFYNTNIDYNDLSFKSVIVHSGVIMCLLVF